MTYPATVRTDGPYVVLDLDAYTRDLLGHVATVLAYDLEVGDGQLSRAFVDLADAQEIRENAEPRLFDLACSHVDAAVDEVLKAMGEPELAVRMLPLLALRLGGELTKAGTTYCTTAHHDLTRSHA